MHKLTLSLLAGAVALTAGGSVLAQQADGRPARPPMTRAAAEQRAAQVFDRLDANHDGKIDAADRALRQKARFDRIDANHDGQISYAEFTAMQTQRGGDNVRKDGERAGRRGHQGGHRMAAGGFRGHGSGQMRLADANNDGTISKAEFVTAADQRFDRLDANKDGTVTPDEAKAARDSMRQQWQARRQGQAG